MKRSVLIGFVLVGILLVWVVPRLSPPCLRPGCVGAGSSYRRRRIAAIREGSRLAEGPGKVEDGIWVRRRNRCGRSRVGP